MRFATNEFSTEIHMEVASFIKYLCETSTTLQVLTQIVGYNITIQMFMACHGSPVLISFLSASYAANKKLVWMALEDVSTIFDLQGLSSKNDFCRSELLILLTC